MNDKKFKQIFPFEKPRKLQRKLIEKITEYFDEGYQHIVVNAPTGIGKSIVAVAVANYFLDIEDSSATNSAYILTSQKLLQDQYVKDFSVPTVKGRANYKCTFEKGTCEGAICVRKKWKKTQRIQNCPNCPYYTARDKTYNNPISVLNYSFFLNMGIGEPENEIQTNRKLLIMDECTNAEAIVIDHSSVIMDRFQCNKFNFYGSVLDFPSVDTSEEAKFNWLLNVVYPEFCEEYKIESVNFESLTPEDSSYMSSFKKLQFLKDMKCKIQNIKEEYEAGMPCAVIQKSNKEIKFKPIFGKNLAKKYLLPFSSRTLSMSATVLSKEQYCRDMGFKKEETMFIRLPSLFPVYNRKIYSIGVGSMSYKNKVATLPKIAETVELLLEKHKGQRGIIHTVNYETAEYLIGHLNSQRLIMPRGKTRDAEIEYFMKSSQDDLVLISPSLQEGIDLKDDLSRFTIICKVPYASLADDWVKKRMGLSPNWYSEQAVQSIIQMTGRSVRTESDTAVGYILDSDFNWFYKRNKSKFLNWWSESLIIK